nr:MAG TPA: hypothetical protein [Bacteriophage sp.]
MEALWCMIGRRSSVSDESSPAPRTRKKPRKL